MISVEESISLNELCKKIKNIITEGLIKLQYPKEKIEIVTQRILDIGSIVIFKKTLYQYPYNITNIIYTVTIRELDEIVAVDLPQLQVNNNKEIDYKQVHSILYPLIDENKIEQLLLEYNTKETYIAKHIYYCYLLYYSIDLLKRESIKLEKSNIKNIKVRNKKI